MAAPWELKLSVFENYILTNYEIYQKMYEENKDISWAYNIIFLEAYLEGDKQL